MSGYFGKNKYRNKEEIEKLQAEFKDLTWLDFYSKLSTSNEMMNQERLIFLVSQSQKNDYYVRLKPIVKCDKNNKTDDRDNKCQEKKCCENRAIRYHIEIFPKIIWDKHRIKFGYPYSLSRSTEQKLESSSTNPHNEKMENLEMNINTEIDTYSIHFLFLKLVCLHFGIKTYKSGDPKRILLHRYRYFIILDENYENLNNSTKKLKCLDKKSEIDKPLKVFQFQTKLLKLVDNRRFNTSSKEVFQLVHSDRDSCANRFRVQKEFEVQFCNSGKELSEKFFDYLDSKWISYLQPKINSEAKCEVKEIECKTEKIENKLCDLDDGLCNNNKKRDDDTDYSCSDSDSDCPARSKKNKKKLKRKNEIDMFEKINHSFDSETYRIRDFLLPFYMHNLRDIFLKIKENYLSTVLPDGINNLILFEYLNTLFIFESLEKFENNDKSAKAKYFELDFACNIYPATIVVKLKNKNYNFEVAGLTENYTISSLYNFLGLTKPNIISQFKEIQQIRKAYDLEYSILTSTNNEMYQELAEEFYLIKKNNSSSDSDEDDSGDSCRSRYWDTASESEIEGPFTDDDKGEGEDENENKNEDRNEDQDEDSIK